MLNRAEINAEMSSLNNWSFEGSAINKIFQFENFKSALEFVNKVGEVAEKHNHHPDIILNYNLVRLSLTTHSATSLTKIDFIVAKEIDGIENVS